MVTLCVSAANWYYDYAWLVMILACDKSSEVCLGIGIFMESGPTGMLMDRLH